MTDSNHSIALQEQIAEVSVWSRGDQRAPHKPLLLLQALGRLQRNETRLVRYEEVEGPLRQLLALFGPPRKSHHPEYPFFYLKNDGLWEFKAEGPLTLRKGKNSPTRASLIQSGASGGFPQALHSLLQADPRLLSQVALQLLDDHFPETLHAEILDAVGLAVSSERNPRAMRQPRDPEFRPMVLRAYNYRCAVCGYDAQLDGSVVGLEAAHMKWHRAQGPDQIDNGLALCSLHHKSLDYGLITVDRDHRVQVSARVSGGGTVERSIVRYHQSPLVGPQPGVARLEERYLAWHEREVFKGPARVG